MRPRELFIIALGVGLPLALVALLLVDIYVRFGAEALQRAASDFAWIGAGTFAIYAVIWCALVRRGP